MHDFTTYMMPSPTLSMHPFFPSPFLRRQRTIDDMFGGVTIDTFGRIRQDGNCAIVIVAGSRVTFDSRRDLVNKQGH